jgi:hypothetical protein
LLEIKADILREKGKLIEAKKLYEILIELKKQRGKEETSF